MKFPVLIAGAGAAAQALSALAGGATALVGALTSATVGIGAMVLALGPLIGALASAAAGYGMLGQAMIAVKLAQVKDLTAALQGNEDAMKRLQPAAQEFVETLKGMESQWNDLRGAVQEKLFTGLSAGIDDAVKNFGAFRKVMVGTGDALGSWGKQLGALLGSKGFGRDFVKFGTTNNIMLERLGTTIVNLVSALRHVLVVARPLNMWLSKMAIAWSANLEASAKAGRETGTLARSFGRTQRVIKVLGDALGNLWDTLQAFGAAAFRPGMALWKDFEKWTEGVRKWAQKNQNGSIAEYFERARHSLHVFMQAVGPFTKALLNILNLGQSTGNRLFRDMADAAEHFEKWTESAAGKNAIKEYFKDILPPLRAAGSLLRDLTVGLVKMGGKNADVTTDLLNQIRVDLLPRIFKLLTNTTKRLGPELITMFDELIKAFIHLAGASGPLILFLKVVNTTLKGVNFLLQNQVIRSFAVWAITLLSVGKVMKWVVGGLMALRNAFIVQKVIIPLVEAFMAFRNGLLAMTAAEGAAATATTGLGLAFRGLLLASGVGAAILAATLIVQHWDKVKAVLGAVWDWMKGAASAVGKAVAGAFTWLADKVWWAMEHGFLGPIAFVITKWKTVVAVFKWVFNAIKNIFETGFKVVKTIITVGFVLWSQPFRLLWKIIGGPVKKVWNIVKGVFRDGVNVVKTIVGGFINIVKDRFADIKAFITGPLRSAWNWIKEAFGNIAGWFGDKFGKVKDVVKSALQGVGGFFSGIWDSMKSGFISAMNWVIDKVNVLINAFNKLPGPNIGTLSPIFDAATDPAVQSMHGRGGSGQRTGKSVRSGDRIGAQRGGLVTSRGVIPFQGFQAGGVVGGAPQRVGPKDTVPAMLQPGEIVLPVDMVKKTAKTTSGTGKVIKKFQKWHDKTFDDMRKLVGKDTDDTRKTTIKNYEKMNKESSREADRLKDTTSDRMSRIQEVSNAQADKMRAGVSGSYRSMTSAGKDAIRELEDATNKALKALGVAPVSFGVSAGGGESDRGGGGQKKAMGGALVPGRGNGDKVPFRAMLEPGERVFVLNKNASRKSEKALEATNRRWPRYAKGGVIEQALGPYDIPPITYAADHAGGNSHLHLDFFTKQQALTYGHKMQGMGWTIGEYSGSNPYGFGGITTQHQSPGHYDGTAFDANKGVVEARADVAAIAKLLGGGGLPMVGAMVSKLKKLAFTGPEGPLKNILKAVESKVRGAADKYIAKHTPTEGMGYVGGGGGPVVEQMARILLGQGFSKAGAAGIIGNAYRESGWDPGAVGTGGGGLFGFTTGDVSLAALQSFAKKEGRPWTDVGLQMQFMLANPNSGGLVTDSYYNNLEAFLKKTSDVVAATTRFMNEWERPGIPALEDRIAGAQRAMQTIQSMGGGGGRRHNKLAAGGWMFPYAGSFMRGGVVPGPIGAPRSAIVHGGETINRPSEGLVASGRARVRSGAGGNVGRMSGRMRIENWKDGTAMFEVIAEDVADELIEADKRASRRG